MEDRTNFGGKLLMSKKNKQQQQEPEEVTVEDMPVVEDSAVEEEEQISKVREILFGSKSRQLENSLGRLEERLKVEQDSIRREFHERFDSLESYIKGEVKALLEQLEREGSSRVEADKKLDERLRETGEELSDRAEQINKRLDESERELRDQILQTKERLTDDIQGRTQELTERLQSEARDLRKGKADRTTIAALLTDMATRLADAQSEDEA